eukprot:GHVL01012554.1.p1 GENE.GHVL01012554.1~~GHVL01012554.1.p1  ORF type:complete len:196 (+),score=40.66 GHVL01012554.1:202-789(+)
MRSLSEVLHRDLSEWSGNTWQSLNKIRMRIARMQQITIGGKFREEGSALQGLILDFKYKFGLDFEDLYLKENTLMDSLVNLSERFQEFTHHTVLDDYEKKQKKISNNKIQNAVGGPDDAISTAEDFLKSKSMNTKRMKYTVEILDRAISDLGGNLGGWHVDDHNTFIKLVNRIGSTSSPVRICSFFKILRDKRSF